MDIAEILSQNFEGAEWVLSGNDYDGLQWLDKNISKPTKVELQKQIAEAEYKQKFNMVKIARHKAYTAPEGSDAIFLKYQRGEATKQDWLDAVQAINDANPYPVNK